MLLIKILKILLIGTFCLGIVFKVCDQGGPEQRRHNKYQADQKSLDDYFSSMVISRHE